MEEYIMDLDIRKNVISNFKGNTANEIIETIDTATTSKDELVLPFRSFIRIGMAKFKQC